MCVQGWYKKIGPQVARIFLASRGRGGKQQQEKLESTLLDLSLVAKKNVHTYVLHAQGCSKREKLGPRLCEIG